jgi:hypothetical protein
MNAETDLLDACREWRRLAEAEGESLTGRNWKLVAACQIALAKLQPRITRLLQLRLQEKLQSGSDCDLKSDDRIQTVFADLIRLEQQNAVNLARLRLDAVEKLQQLELANRNLHCIQRSYARPPSAAWCSTS